MLALTARLFGLVLNQAFVAATVESLAATIKSEYFDPQVGINVDAALRRSLTVNARFSVTIPNGQVKSAVGGGNWEGPGVTPDVKTAAADALRVAHARALRGLIEHEPPGP